jgi:hypothetical protein
MKQHLIRTNQNHWLSQVKYCLTTVFFVKVKIAEFYLAQIDPILTYFD